MMPTIWTIGYQAATPSFFLQALRDSEIDLLLDVRAVASSRRPGFSKSPLAASVLEIGIEYLHLRTLGTPAEGRAAARAGRHDVLRTIYAEHLATAAAQTALATVADVVHAGRRACLLCFEADPAHCHRNLIAAALAARFPLQVVHLMPAISP